ncbi:HEPN domain-containing protein [Pedobacter psychrodurus]|uniref:HEPN domain-containing protein n=1 Tax=Pedobacter psychrodurus TaxID=2530456 RepID=A0A4R0Q5A7_9SPHI|nr:HEPN domain-containing protein [Pedobacter psychrodurus]TCD27777.1 HEPN domain-containing protein [Pedobacter psychrodurus]
MKTPTLSIEFRHGTAFCKLISELSEKFQPLQIFCFYKRSSQEKRLSCFVNERANSSQEYGLLLVTPTATRIDYEVQDYANSHFAEGTITVICHGNQSVWEAIDANSRFFKAVFTCGELLYSHDGLLMRPYVQPYDPVNGGTKALKHYNHRMPLAEGFLTGAAQCLAVESYNISVFMLHQTVEQICILLIRVHIAYRSEFHNLNRLLRLCQSFSELPHKMFFESAESRRLFEVLSRSYSAARYKDDFSVSRKDAESLFTLIESFVAVAKSMCEKKIEMLEEQATSFAVSEQTAQLSPEILATEN